MLYATLTGHTCGDACWQAKEDVCRCSCGGKNHGILANGGNRPERTCRHGGAMYRLAEMGNHRDIEQSRFRKVKDMGCEWYYDPYGPWIAKPASKSQLKWPELSAYHQGVYILWERLDNK